MTSAAGRIRAQALALGFDAVGFARAELGPDAKAHLAEFLSLGLYGDMGWLAAKADRRSDPRQLWPGARTVLVVGASYAGECDPLEIQSRREVGAISIYAQGRDYHDVIKRKLRVLGRWIVEEIGGEAKLFVDTAPVMEKPLAARTPLGWQGKHTNLVSRKFGSWLFLGELFLSIELEPEAAESDHCGSCRRCLDACPTGAFPAPYRIDARRCISYLTIEHKGPIPREFRPLIGNRIFGCDDCLAVCPWNKFAATAAAEFRPREALRAPALAELARLDDAGFRAMFAGTSIKRIGRNRFLRNVLIAIGNSGDRGLIAAAEHCLLDASALVRGAAVWALGRLLGADALADRQAAGESDPQVLEEWQTARAAPHGQPILT
jgi:epoxyqueuosine reductase